MLILWFACRKELRNVCVYQLCLVLPLRALDWWNFLWMTTPWSRLWTRTGIAIILSVLFQDWSSTRCNSQEPKSLDGQAGAPKPFRYTVKRRAKVNVFEPKALAPNVNWQDVRYSMFGAAYLSDGLGLSKIPDTARASILWEVGLVGVLIFSFLATNL